jgi:predicted porin
MKKSLIALAVLGFTGAAMAQSSVTLYGVADAGIARTQTFDANGDKVSKNGMSSAGLMNNGTSRLGVRGVEDLGGGLKAGFNFETGLSLKDGATSTAGAGYWGRAANLWLGGNWGTFKMGRTLNPSFYGVATWELTGVANYSVVGSTYGCRFRCS